MANSQKIQLVKEPEQSADSIPCYANIREEVTDRILWQGGPYPDRPSAERAAARQLKRLKGRKFPPRRSYV